MMKGILIIPVVLILVSCTSITTKTPSQDQQPAEPTPAVDPFIRDGKGNVINTSGWQLPALPANRKYEPTILQTGERKVNGLTFSFMPKVKMVVTIPKYWEDGEVTYKVTQISELKGKDQPPYCYNFTVTHDWPDPGNHPGISTFFSYRDVDGDGVFETLGQGCTIPGWVK